MGLELGHAIGSLPKAVAAACAMFCASMLIFSMPAGAETVRPTAKPPATAFSSLKAKAFNIFDSKLDARNIFKGRVVHVPNEQKQDAQAAAPAARSTETNGAAAPQRQSGDTASAASVSDEKGGERGRLIEYWSDKPGDNAIRPPHENPSVRVNPEAPSSILGMIQAMREGDDGMADAYADQYVRYLQNYFFEIREITQIIGEAMIRQRVIDEDDWRGVPHMIDYELAKTRQELGAVIKPTHDAAMRQIEPDPKHQVEIYYFFTLNCSWCRYMAADVERLWRLVKDDPKVKMVALTLGPTPQDWAAEYRTYTGMTVPIFDGSDVAAAFNVAFVPAVVVVTPNKGTAYIKTGQQNFEHLYQYVRTAQGLPAVVTKEFQRLQATPIGEAELLRAKGPGAIQVSSTNGNAAGAGARPVALPGKEDTLERF